MLRYLARRALSSLIALMLFVTLMFFVTQVMIPGDFTTQFIDLMRPEAREALRQELGLTRPLWVQYLNWLRILLAGSLGLSYYGVPVVEVLKSALPYTLLVFCLGTVLAFQLGQWTGRWVTWASEVGHPLPRPVGKFLAGTASFGGVLLYTSFPPWLAFLVTYFLSRRLVLDARDFHRAASRAASAFNFGVWLDAKLSPHAVMVRIAATFVVAWLLVAGVNALVIRRRKRPLPVPALILAFAGLWVGSWYALGFGPLAMSLMSFAGIPMVTYVLLTFGEIMLITRTSMTDTLREDYITTARAKGVPERAVRDRHAARTALLPVISRLVVSLPYMLTGVVIVEDVLGWPGISRMLFNSLYQQDMPTVMGALLLVGVLSAIARIVLDVLYVYLDPRIRYARYQGAFE